MSSGCCGVKRTKLADDEEEAKACNGKVNDVSQNGACHVSDLMQHQVILPEMCFYCFDVLRSQLYNLDSPRKPSFTNDA